MYHDVEFAKNTHILNPEYNVVSFFLLNHALTEYWIFHYNLAGTLVKNLSD